MSTQQEQGRLWVVATPLGNLGDMTPRAREVLASVDRVAAEDTRHSSRLLHHYGIETPMVALHDHNEAQRVEGLIAQMRDGASIALVSDAGTPLISDPGFRLVRAAHAAGIAVAPVPGACAAIAALSVAGLPSDRFVFEGFPPARQKARRDHFAALKDEVRTLIFYESPHRIEASLQDMVWAFGGTRQAVLARELTKTFETVLSLPLADLAARVATDLNQRRGELVVLLAGASEAATAGDGELRAMLTTLLDYLSPRDAAAVAARLTGERRNRLYSLALEVHDGLQRDA